MHRILTHVPGGLRSYRSEVTAQLDAVITRAVAKDPAQRFESAGAFAAALRAARAWSEASAVADLAQAIQRGVELRARRLYFIGGSRDALPRHGRCGQLYCADHGYSQVAAAIGRECSTLEMAQGCEPACQNLPEMEKAGCRGGVVRG